MTILSVILIVVAEKFHLAYGLQERVLSERKHLQDSGAKQQPKNPLQSTEKCHIEPHP